MCAQGRAASGFSGLAESSRGGLALTDGYRCMYIDINN